MTKYNLPLTYAPKIPGVLDGSIRQAFLSGRRFVVGDNISFNDSDEYFELKQVIDCTIYPNGFRVTNFYYWTDWEIETLAKWEGIDPPTGVELGRMLVGMGILGQAQIVRW